MRQISLLPGGIYRVGNNVLYADKNRLFYRSTMAVYVISRSSKSPTIEKILCVSDRSILTLAFSPHDENLMTMFGADGGLTLWSIGEEKVLNRCTLQKLSYATMEWDPVIPSAVIIVTNYSGLRVQRWDVHRQASDMQELYHFADKSVVPTVIRASPSAMNKLAVACSGGRVYYFDLSFTKSYTKLHDKSFPASTSIVDMQWDKLSAQYLLVAYDNFLCMWDVVTNTQIQLFEKQTVSISSIAWLDWAAGSFVSTNPKTGILKMWNASQKVPIESIRAIPAGGIQSVFPVPNSKSLLLACVDGSFHLYNIQHKHSEYKTSTSHSETIFNCAFNPTSFDQFASCSYDGTVRVWKLSDMSLVQYLHADDGIIYSVCWSPNGKLVVGSTIQGTIIVWDVASTKEVARFKHHTKPSFCVAWSALLDRMLLSTSSDGTAFVFELESELIDAVNVECTGSDHFKKKPTRPPVLMKFNHPAPVFGCAWSPFKAKMFCTGCQDSIVRVFDYGVSTSPTYTLNGHSARVFNCMWSPLIEGTLASGADDLSIQVWDITVYTSGNTGGNVVPKKTLRGHVANVRALSWNYEHKVILLSGSWDKSIRVWDVLNGVCLKAVYDHAADVYSVVSHPMRPFSYLSCSRDSTVRLWVLDTIASHLKVIAIADESLARIKDGSFSSGSSSPSRPTTFRAGRIFHPSVDIEESDLIKGFNGSPKKPNTIAASASPPQSNIGIRKTPNLPAIAAHKQPGMFSLPAFGMGALSCPTLNQGADERIVTPCEIISSHGSNESIPLPQLIYGKYSSTIHSKLNTLDESLYGSQTDSSWEANLVRAEKFYNIFSLFSGSVYALDLWEAALSLIAAKIECQSGSKCGISSMLLRPKSDMTVTLENEIISKSRSDARKLESVKIARKGILSNKNIEKLREAAMINIRIGDFEKYCNIMVDLGDWQSALAMAPRVSMIFWQSTCDKYADHLLEQGNEECVPYLLASGREEIAANFYIARGDSKSGIVIAKSSQAFVESAYEEAKVIEHAKSTNNLMDRISRSVAMTEVRKGNVVLAAAQVIASCGDYEFAIEQLMACYEFELAYALGSCFGVDLKPITMPLVYKCASDGQLSVALDLLQKFDQIPSVSSLLVSASCKTEEQANIFINMHSLTSIEEWCNNARGASKDSGEDIDVDVCALVCGRLFGQAVQVSIRYLRKNARMPLDDNSKATSIIQSLKHAQLADLEGSDRLAILSYLFWFSSFEACKQGQFETGWNMLRCLRQSNSYPLGITSTDILLQEFLFRLAAGDRDVVVNLRGLLLNNHLSAQCLEYLHLIDDNLAVYFTSADQGKGSEDDPSLLWGESTSLLFREAQKLSDALSLPSFWSYSQLTTSRVRGVAEGSTLPSAKVSSSSLNSYLTQSRINGVPIVLEDGITVISLNEAFAWVQIMPFSPLMTGERIRIKY